jgi:iron complex outermembrane receptor protein
MRTFGVKVILLCGAAMLPATAWAQTAPAATPAATSVVQVEPEAQDQAAAIDDVVVTAQRREQRLQDVPVSVAVTSGATIARTNIRSLEDLSFRTPALKVAKAANADILTIRGIGSGQNGGFENAVGTFVDGVYRGRSRSSRTALFDIDRVEVLRGPQTTFFGNNTIAGALNITTVKPSQTFGYNANLLYTPETGEYGVEAGVTGPLTDTLSARGVFKFSGMDGYVYNDFLNADQPHMRDMIGRVALRWEPTENFRSDLRVDRVHNRDIGVHISEIEYCPPDAAYGNPAGACAAYIAKVGLADVDDELNYRIYNGPSYFNYDMTEVAFTNALTVNDFVITSTTGYFDHDSAITTQGTPIGVTGVAGYLRTPFLNPETYESFSQELRLESPGEGFLRYVLGAYYAHANLVSEGYSGIYSAPFGQTYAPGFYTAADPIAQHRTLRQVEDNRSVFGALTANFTDHLRLNLGARYTSIQKTAHRSFEVGIGGAIPGPDNFIPGPAAAQVLIINGFKVSAADFADPDATFSKFLPSASVQYDVFPNSTLYASYTKGFKAGGFADATTPIVFASEVADAYELGIKGTLARGSVYYGLNVYLSNFANLQESVTVVSPQGVTSSIIGNAAEARSQGVEASFSWRLSPNLSFRADGAYSDSKYLSYPGAQCTQLQAIGNPTCVQDLSGSVRAFAPEWTGSASLSATFPMANGYELRFDPSVYFTSKVYLTQAVDPLLAQGDYAKFDARLGFGPADRSWEVAVIGKNLTDELTYNQSSIVGTSPGTVSRFLDEPRTFSVTFSIRH